MKKTLVLLLLLVLCALAHAKKPPGVLLLLDGTGSAGKSSIGRELQSSLKQAVFLNEEMLVFNAYNDLLRKHKLQPPKPLHNIGEMIRYRQTLPGAAQAVLKQEFKLTSDAYIQRDTRRLIRQSMGQGHPIIILDNTLWKPELVQKWHEETRGYNTLHVLVYCPLNNLLEHIQKRNRAPQSYEHRDLSLPLEMYFSMYTPAPRGIDTLERSKVKRDLRACFAYQKTLTGRTPPDSLQQTYLHRFHLDVQGKVQIAPFFAYDLVVNTGTSSPRACAAQIQSRLFANQVPLR